MTFKINERRVLWEKRFAQQKASGLSMQAWCLKNDINIHTYKYWKCRLGLLSSNDSFIELPKETNISSGIEIIYREFCIKLNEDFDQKLLIQCLRAFQGLQ